MGKRHILLTLTIAAGLRLPAAEPSLPETAQTGEKRGLVLLVNFKNRAMQSENTPAEFHNMFNKPGYDKNGNAGSVRDYFLDQSYQQLTIDFDIVGPLQAEHEYAYYGANNDEGYDKRAATLAIEACRLADEQGTDFSRYDWDGDGIVEQVFIVYAGHGEAQGASANTIWPHEWTLTEALEEFQDGEGAQTIDGVVIDTYAMSCELSGVNSKTPDGIGTACHEFCHCLGYPDFYDTSYSGGAGMLKWDLMAGGSYNGPGGHGECPPPFTAYERMEAGWLEPVELSTPTHVIDMPALTSQPVAYIIYNNQNRNEYCMLENHQAQKWDEYTHGRGLLAIRVEYDETAWSENKVNNDASHQRMTYIPADNSYGIYYSNKGQWYASVTELEGDTYPGLKENTTLSIFGNTVSDIRMSPDGLISFKFTPCDPTGIEETTGTTPADDTATALYSISGIKVEKTDRPGIYIQNGRKILK